MNGEIAVRLGVALAIGLLVGLERGWRERDEPDRSRTAGIRTYGIGGLLGGVFGLLSTATGSPAVLIAGFAVFAIVLTVYKLREAIADADYSATAAITGLAVFALGALAVEHDPEVAGACGVALTALLASREVLHRLLRSITWEELRAALILAVMSIIVLPILPARPVDPWNGVNPYEIWLFTILVASLSYTGYVAIRVLGPSRGLLLSSILGAIVSSTAVTLALARRAEESLSQRVGAAALAAAVSIGRVCVIVLIAAPALVAPVVFVATPAALVFAVVGGVLLWNGVAVEAEEVKLKNPFELSPLLLFAASFAAIAAASAYLAATIGNAGLLAASAMSALIDVDVAVLTATRQLRGAGHPVEPGGIQLVVDAVLLSLLVNGLARAGLTWLAGSLRFAVAHNTITLLATTAACVIWFLLR